MSRFNNSTYEALVTDTLNDTFYTDTSYRGKISAIRRYAEVIVRKLIDYDEGKQLTLGNHQVQNRIDSLNNSQVIKEAVRIINADGSNCTHSQYTDNVYKEDFELKVDKLFDLLSMFLINYFEKYKFGSRNEVLYSFSMLPPIIRYKVLIFLYEKDPTNISIIDKLVLAIMKAFDVDTASKWIEERKDNLVSMKTVSEKAFNDMKKSMGIEFALLMQSSSPANMYELCRDKICKVGDAIQSNGVMYSDFESALPIYRQNGILEGNEPEIIEFNDIMNFLYLGRQEAVKKISTDTAAYTVINFIS